MKHLTIKQRRNFFPFLVLGVVFCFCRMRVKWRKGSFSDLVVCILVLIFCEAFFLLKILQQQSTISFLPAAYTHSLKAAQQMKHSLFITRSTPLLFHWGL